MPVQELSEKAEPTIGSATIKPAVRTSDTATLIQLFKGAEPPSDSPKNRVDPEKSDSFSSGIYLARKN